MLILKLGKFALVIFLALAFLSFITNMQSVKDREQFYKSQEAGTKPLSIGQAKLRVFVADTDALRERGLGGREFLPEGQGMIFIFEDSGVKSFWMKDMKFPVDMIWLSEKRQVVFLENSVSPSSYPKVFAPKVLAKYVLEVPSGFAVKNGIKIGDKVSF